MGRTFGETVKALTTTGNYLAERIKVSDEFIGLMDLMFPDEYEQIKQKEEDYQALLTMMTAAEN